MCVFAAALPVRPLRLRVPGIGKPLSSPAHLPGKRLEELTPAGHKAQIDLSITDDFPLAQAIVIISATAAG